jgi:hypothetical protein
MIRRFLGSLFLIAIAAKADAQCGHGGPQTPASVPGAIVGLITDESNHPLENITITVANPRRLVRTNAAGEFRIDSVPQGILPIVVRRIGFEAGGADITVTEKGGTARICMSEETVGLPTMVTSIFRGGLSGIVADTNYRPIRDAEIRINAANKYAYTDSTGSFFIDLKPGSYAAIVGKKGFGRQVVSVTIPPDSGRQIAVWLTKADGWDFRRAADLDGLRYRGAMLPKSQYSLMTREDLAGTSMDLYQAVRIKGIGAVNEFCDVGIAGDGSGYSVPLWSLDKSEIEMLEVVAAPIFSTRGQTSMMGASKPIGQAGVRKANLGGASGCDVTLIAWLRR